VFIEANASARRIEPARRAGHPAVAVLHRREEIRGAEAMILALASGLAYAELS
jgi:hypothetical protein